MSRLALAASEGKMMNIDQTITRPALRYYGGQWNNAPWIISHWPAHETRIIPFMGGLNDELRAPRARLTNASDLDDRVVNFFQVLRDHPDDLIRVIRLTPWHEGEYEISQSPHREPLEDARRFWCACWMSVSGGPKPGKSGFRWTRDRDGRWSTPATDSLNINHLHLVAERLRHIHFLKRDGLELIDDHLGIEKSLIWCDPPFIKETRASGANSYAHETSEQLHFDLAALLQRANGYVAITGYAWNPDGYKNQMYELLYEAHGWVRVDSNRRVNGGGTRQQSLWLSPRTWDALQIERYPLLAGIKGY
jgi:DNA adenine methylase